MPSAPPTTSALASYIGSVHRELSRFVAGSDWTACYAFLEANDLRHAPKAARPISFGTMPRLSRRFSDLPTPRTGTLATSTAGAELAARRVLGSRRERSFCVSDGVLAAAGRLGSARSRCLIAKESFGLLAAAPIEDARRALGWLGRYDRLCSRLRSPYAATFIACSSRSMPSSITASAAVSGTRMRMTLP